MAEKPTSEEDVAGLVQGAIASADAVIAGIAEFTEAVALIEAAMLGIDEHVALAKWSIDEHVGLAKGGIDTHVAMAKAGIDTHVAVAKNGINQHAAAAVAQAIQSNMQTIVNAVLEAISRQGYTA